MTANTENALSPKDETTTDVEQANGTSPNQKENDEDEDIESKGNTIDHLASSNGGLSNESISNKSVSYAFDVVDNDKKHDVSSSLKSPLKSSLKLSTKSSLKSPIKNTTISSSISETSSYIGAIPGDSEPTEFSHPKSPSMHSRMSMASHMTEAKIGGTYTKHELAFVTAVGIVLSFNAGYLNGCCLSGLLHAHGTARSVAGFTGYYTNGALQLADGAFAAFRTSSCMILCLLCGSAFSSFMTPTPTPHQLEPSYGPTFLVGGALIIAASIMAAYEASEFYYLVAAANGIQNGMSSMYSANLIRSTHLTGTSTDIGLFLGQYLRGNKKNFWKLLVLSALASSFWLGGLISYYATQIHPKASLLFSAGLYCLIGTFFITFLVFELHVTVMAAISGHWSWGRVFDHLEEFLQNNETFREKTAHTNTNPKDMTRSQRFVAYYDAVVEGDEDEEMDADALYDALRAAGVQITPREVAKLMQHADTDHTGTLSREEWQSIAREAKKRYSQRFPPSSQG